MASNERANQLGFATPGPTTLINTGDDDISQNARAAVDLFDQAMALRDEAQKAAILSRSAVLAAAWDGPVLQQSAAPSNKGSLWIGDTGAARQWIEGNVGTVNEARQHATHSATAWLSPGGTNVRFDNGRVTATTIIGAAFSLRVNDLAFGVPVTQGQTVTYSALVGASAAMPETAKLRILWWKADGTVAGFSDGTPAVLPTGTGSRWSVTGTAPANAATANTQLLSDAPATIVADAWITDVSMTFDGSTTYISGDRAGYQWTGEPGLSPVTGAGTGWVEVTEVADLTHKRGAGSGGSGDPLEALDPGLAHQVRRDRMRNRRGGTIGVGTRQVVSVRLDHGWMEAQNNGVADLLDDLDIPFHLAMCSDYAGGGVEAPVDWDTVRAAARSLGAEIGNHSRTHASDASGIEAQRVEIIDGLSDLQALIPEQHIEVWTQPSITGTQYDGYGMAKDPATLYGTTAGRMLLAHHGFVAGIGDRWVPLDGTPTQGMSATFTDTRTPAATIALVENARTHTPGLGFVLAFHPAYVGNAGYQTLADLTTWLTWLAAERDAGRVELLTHAGLACAASRDEQRHALASWSGSIPAAGSQALGAHTGTLPVQGSAYYGGMWQAVADVEAPAGADVTLTATCGTATATKTVTLAAGQRATIRRHVLLSLDAGASPVIDVATTGALTVHDLRLHAV